MSKKVKKTKTWSFLLSSIFIFFIINTASSQYAVGDTVIDFTLNDVDGNNISLFNNKGNLVLLNFFATW
jgi:cytochrome oxidase Cu insertion factor (SCO1/SenC/PrrC family)